MTESITPEKTGTAAGRRQNRRWLRQMMNPYFFIAMRDEPDALALLERELAMLRQNRRMILADREKSLILALVNQPGHPLRHAAQVAGAGDILRDDRPLRWAHAGDDPVAGDPALRVRPEEQRAKSWPGRRSRFPPRSGRRSSASCGAATRTST